MKAVKTMIALAVVASCNTNANTMTMGDYLPTQGVEDYEYAIGNNPDMTFVIKGETAVIGSTNGKYPSEFDLGKLVGNVSSISDKLEELKLSAEQQEDANQTLLNEVDFAVSKAGDAQATANQNKTDIEDINSRLDNIAPVDISGKANQSELDAVKAIADQASKDALSASGEATGAINVAIDAKADAVKAQQTANQNKTDITAINDRLDNINISPVDISGKADKTDLDTKADKSEVQFIKDALSTTVSKMELQDVDNKITGIATAVNTKADKTDLDLKANQSDLEYLFNIKADKNTVQAVEDKVNGVQNAMLDKADKAQVESISIAVSAKADKADVDAAHTKADQINAILHGSTAKADSGDVGLIAQVDQNKTDIQVVSGQVAGIVDSVNAAANQAAEAVSKVDVATAVAGKADVKADQAQQTANEAKTKIDIAETKADTAFTTANNANQTANHAYGVADTAYNMAQTTQKQVAGFDGRITSVENQVQGLNKSFSDLKKQVDKNRKEANAGIAGANAIASIPTIAGSRFSLGAGIPFIRSVAHCGNRNGFTRTVSRLDESR
ncbi:MAG: hypothetical protein RSE38_01955 [Acinetobacter sp.]